MTASAWRLGRSEPLSRSDMVPGRPSRQGGPACGQCQSGGVRAATRPPPYSHGRTATQSPAETGRRRLGRPGSAGVTAAAADSAALRVPSQLRPAGG